MSDVQVIFLYFHSAGFVARELGWYMSQLRSRSCGSDLLGSYGRSQRVQAQNNEHRIR